LCKKCHSRFHDKLCSWKSFKSLFEVQIYLKMNRIR
jgi:hypothetical protein